MQPATAKCINQWQSKLLDLSKRNRLINYKTGSRGGLRLDHPDPSRIWQAIVCQGKDLRFVRKQDLLSLSQLSQLSNPPSVGKDDSPREARDTDDREAFQLCLKSPGLKAHDLLTRTPDEPLAKKLQRLALNAQTSLSEQGVNTLYLACGFLGWSEPGETGAKCLSPLLLVPVSLRRPGPDAYWELSLYEEEVVTNHCLAQLLGVNFGLTLPAEEAAESDFAGYLSEVRRLVQGQATWHVEDQVHLSIFGFQKVAMWSDLDQNRERVASHPLCRAIAGDASVMMDLAARNQAELKVAKDQVISEDFTCILDCDSSQQEAILAAQCGMNLVLDGPPGTGKSQTIANIIALFLAAGKTVLFVSEKAAALEVVKRRLDERRLGDFCLECHSHKANKKDVIAELGRSLALPPENNQTTTDFAGLMDLRAELNGYVEALHAVRQPLGLSAYEAHGIVLRLTDTVPAAMHFRDVTSFKEADVQLLCQSLRELKGCPSVIARYRDHPWRGCRLAHYTLGLEHDVRHGFFQLASDLRCRLSAFAELQSLGFCAQRLNTRQLTAVVAAAQEALRFPSIPAAWFEKEPRQIAQSILEIHSLSAHYARLRRQTAAYRNCVVSELDPAWINWLAQQTWLKPRGPNSGWSTSVRELPSRLRETRAAVERLHEAHQHVRAHTDALMGVMQIRLSGKTAMNSARRLVEVGTLISGIGETRPGWFDARRRIELAQVAARCSQDHHAIEHSRQALEHDFLSIAFDEDSRAFAGRAEGFRRFWNRSGRSWRDYRARALTFYRNALPRRAPQILDDMHRLTVFHSQAAHIRQVERSHADDIVSGLDGRPDWEALQAGLTAIDVLERIAPGLAQRLNQSLSSPGQLNRAALAQAATNLSDAFQFFDACFQVCQGDTWLQGLLGPHSLPGFPLDVISDRLRSACAVLGQAEDFLLRLRALLADNGDVTIEQLRADLSELEELRRIKARMQELESRISSVPESNMPPESRDWETEREKAAWLLTFLDRYRDSPPSALVGVVTCPATRARLTGAIPTAETLPRTEVWKFLTDMFDTESDVSTGFVISSAPVEELIQWLEARMSDVELLPEWIRFSQTETTLKRYGIDAVLREVMEGRLGTEEAVNAFLFRFYLQWLSAVYQKDPRLGRFNGEEHERRIEAFCELDQGIIDTAPLRIRSALFNDPLRPRQDAFFTPHSSELGILLHEVNKKRGHLSLRQLFKRAPNLLLRLKPCVMMSPLAVSTYLEAAALQFDLVVFDEASQVRPHEAVCAIYRGRQLVVAGDPKQLPPTTFFEKITREDEIIEGDEDDAADTGDFESILDVCCALNLPRRRLKWHYRSRRETLIAFANHYVYNGELITFPSPRDYPGSSAVQLEYLSNGRWRPGQNGGFNSEEAERTAALVLEHIQDRPHESLGVITFNQRQQLTVVDAIDRLRLQHPLLEEFFKSQEAEPFFVKNLENVQGDERDVIILSVGYGPDQHGTLRMSFGPLNHQGGERRLNVAVTRAKQQMILVTSLRASDIDVKRTAALGARLLQAYLQFAETMPTGAYGQWKGDRAPHLVTFEDTFAKLLERSGITVHRRVGCSNSPIDLALSDPRFPGRFILGIDCDGESYRSAPSTRDRDRLRPAVLEDLGWQMLHVWSTDVVRNPKKHIELIRKAYEDALKGKKIAKARNAGSRRQGLLPSKGEQSLPPITSQTPAGPPRDIADVPRQEIENAIVSLLQRCGAAEEDEVKIGITRHLGYQRMGSKIRAVLEQCIRELCAKGQIARNELGWLVHGIGGNNIPGPSVGVDGQCSAAHETMSEVPRQKLCEIVQKFPREIWQDPKRCKGLLKDLCGENEKEVRVLAAVLSEGIPQQLQSRQGQCPGPALVKILTRQVAHELLLNEIAAGYAVESWALALRVVSPGDLARA